MDFRGEVRVPVLVLALLAVWACLATALYGYSVSRVKTIRGVAEVGFLGDVYITDFQLYNETHVLVELEYAGTGSTPAVVVTVEGAGLSGSASVAGGWSSPCSLYVPVEGELSPGVVRIVVESPAQTA